MRKPNLTQQIFSQLALLVIGLFVIVPIWHTPSRESTSTTPYDNGKIGCACQFAGCDHSL